MSREVRRVPADWQHPVEPGLRYDRGYCSWVPKWVPLYGEDMDKAIGDRERTHWQMYETTSEGTPISPVFKDPYGLSRWLARNHISAFGSHTATEKQWRDMIRGSGVIVGAVMHGDGRIEPGWLDGQGEQS